MELSGCRLLGHCCRFTPQTMTLHTKCQSHTTCLHVSTTYRPQQPFTFCLYKNCTALFLANENEVYLTPKQVHCLNISSLWFEGCLCSTVIQFSHQPAGSNCDSLRQEKTNSSSDRWPQTGGNWLLNHTNVETNFLSACSSDCVQCKIKELSL